MTNAERSRQLRAMLELVRDLADDRPALYETNKILDAYVGPSDERIVDSVVGWQTVEHPDGR